MQPPGQSSQAPPLPTAVKAQGRNHAAQSNQECKKLRHNILTNIVLGIIGSLYLNVCMTLDQRNPANWSNCTVKAELAGKFVQNGVEGPIYVGDMKCTYNPSAAVYLAAVIMICVFIKSSYLLTRR